MRIPRDGDHSRLAPLRSVGTRCRECVVGRGPRPARARAEGRVDPLPQLPRLDRRARRGGQIRPVVGERRLDLDLPLAAEPLLARRRRGSRGQPIPHPTPGQQRAWPVAEGEPHPHAAVDRLALRALPRTRERFPHLHLARHACEHDVHRVGPVRGIEAVAHVARPWMERALGERLHHRRAREDGGHEQEPGSAVRPQQRGNRRLHAPIHALQRRADRVGLGDVLRGARIEPRRQLRHRAVVAADPRRAPGQRAHGDQRPTPVDELGEPLGRPRLEHIAARQHDRAVGLAADPQLTVTHGRGGDAVVVEDVEVACEPVEDAGLRLEPAHAADDVEVDGLRPPPGLARAVEPECRARRRGRVEDADVARVIAPAQRRAQTRDGTGELPVVAPVGLAPVGGGRRPLPPARARRVVGRVRVVERRPRAQPRQQPVERLLERATPAGGVERLDPHPRPLIVVRERRVQLRVAVMVGPGRAEPPVRARVVPVEPARGDRLALARADLLVDAAQQPVPLVPRVQRSKERPLGERPADAVVVASEARAVLVQAVPQRREMREWVVSRLGDEALGEVGRPRRHARQLVLERAGDHRPEQVTDPLLELPVHHREEPPAGERREVVEPALDDVEEHQPPGAGEARHPPVERDPHELAAACLRGGGDRHPAGRAHQRELTVALDHLALEPATRVLGMALHDLSLEVRAGEADLVVEPDSHAELFRVAARALEQLPPRLRHERRIVGVLAVQRTRRRDVHHDHVEHAAGRQPLELPSEPFCGHRVAAPPPERRRRELGRRVGEPFPRPLVHAARRYARRRAFATGESPSSSGVP